MRLELIDSLSLPGNPDKANEDAFAHTDQMAVVFDGVTMISENLMPGDSDAAWLARFAARRVAAHASEGGKPRDWIKHAAGDAEKSFTALRRRDVRERYEIPAAALMLAALDGEALEMRWLGDCSLIIGAPNGDAAVIGDSLENRAKERTRVSSLARAQNLKPAAKQVRAEFVASLRTQRNLVNTGRGRWLFTPDARCARHATTVRRFAPAGTRLLLATDGFFALASDYGCYTPAGLLKAAGRGLAALGAEVRAIETKDAEGVRYPRFKKSDDATAVLLRVTNAAS